jgi:hypothetical protein
MTVRSPWSRQSDNWSAMKLLLVPLVLCLGLVKAQPDPIPVPSSNPVIYNFKNSFNVISFNLFIFFLVRQFHFLRTRNRQCPEHSPIGREFKNIYILNLNNYTIIHWKLPQLSLVNNALGDQLADLEVKVSTPFDRFSWVLSNIFWVRIDPIGRWYANHIFARNEQHMALTTYVNFKYFSWILSIFQCFYVWYHVGWCFIRCDR